jgi:hypothetical protein
MREGIYPFWFRPFAYAFLVSFISVPMMRYLDYTKVRDKEPPPKHIEEFRMHALKEPKKS